MTLFLLACVLDRTGQSASANYERELALAQTRTQELEAERAKTRQFGTVLGQMRYRVTEVLELDPKTRTEILTEIDTVFNRAL